MATPLSPAQDGPVFTEAKSAGSAYPKLTGSRDIRLIRILRREDPNGRMRCEVKIASLDEMIYPYIAFSYIWGDPKPSGKLWYNNDNYFELTESLSLILGWLTRFPQLGDVYVWIDALCINQNDNFEKGAQVPLMGEICSGTQSVFAWVIGDLNAEEHMALMFVQEISTELQKLRERGTEITFEAVEKIPAFKYPSKGWTALAKFLFLPYFQRMWIIQEIVMAREVSVVCGGMMVEWDPFATTMKLLFHTVPRYLSIPQDGGVSIAAPGLRTVCYIYDLKALRQEHRSLELPLALAMCQRFQAANPRDKIFGLLGISTDSKLLALTPDYNASVQEVYTMWTRHLLLNGAPLVLHIAGTGFSRELRDLPSWVPDWSSIPKRESFGMAVRAEFRAAGDSIMKVLPTQNLKSIIVEARHVATVGEVFPPCPLLSLTQNAAEQGEQWVRLLT